MHYKKIKVKFLVRREDLKKWYSDFFCSLLSKRYTIIIDENNPDFIFHEAHILDVIQYSGVRIAITGENVRTNFNISDYGIGFDHLIFKDRYFRFPLYLFYIDSIKKVNERLSFNFSQSFNNFFERRFCNFLVSNGAAAEFRTKFFYWLSEYKQVDSGGKYLKNINKEINDKIEWQSNYKFSLCFENSSTSGYLTEKLIQAFAAKTIPIYWGDPDVLGKIENGKGGINPKAIVLVDQNNPQKALKFIKELNENQELYLSMIKEPLFLDIDHSEKFLEGLNDFLFNIFDQSKEEAYRRGFGQVRLRIEKSYDIQSSGVKKLLNKIKKRIRF